MIILIDNYDSFTWNLYHFLGDIGAETVVHRNDKISVGQVISAKPEAIVISPGPATPNEAGICLELIGLFAANVGDHVAAAVKNGLSVAFLCGNSVHGVIPLHLRNAPTPLLRNLGYGKDYKYAHNYEEHQVTPLL